MPYALYVCLQDDDKIAAFAIDAGSREAHAAGRGAGRRRAVGVGDQPRPADAVCRASRHAGDLELPDRPATGALTSLGTVVDGARADLSRPRPHRQVFAVRLLPGRVAAVHPLGATVRWARRRSTGWPRPPAPTR